MAGTGTGKAKSGNLHTEEGQREKERGTTAQSEERELNDEVEVAEEQRDQGRRTTERNEQQDLNQGMETGTHDSGRHEIDWGPAYQVRSTTIPNGRRKREPKKTSE